MTFAEAFIELINEHEREVLSREKNGLCNFDQCEACPERGYCDNLRGRLKVEMK